MLQAVLLLALFWGASITAQAKSEPDIYHIGISAGWTTYLEPGYVSFYGIMYGLDSTIQLNYKSGFDLRIETDLFYGNIQYDGSVKDITTGVASALKAGAYDYAIVARVKPELELTSLDFGDLFFNLGFGVRYLNDRVNSASGYEREISYLFLPIGFRFEKKLSETRNFGADLEYDYFIAGKVKSHLSDTNPSNPDVSNNQSSGYGWRAQVEYRFLVDDKWYGIKPYYQWWSIGASDAAAFTSEHVLIEPQNDSSSGGVIFDVEF